MKDLRAPDDSTSGQRSASHGGGANSSPMCSQRVVNAGLGEAQCGANSTSDVKLARKAGFRAFAGTLSLSSLLLA
ncbi:MAG: hypothetical protein C4334_02655 [Pyrinomonas sp.]